MEGSPVAIRYARVRTSTSPVVIRHARVRTSAWRVRSSGIIIIKIIIVIIITFNFVIINVTNGGLINCWVALVGLAWEGESAHRLSHLVSAIATLTMRLIAPVIYFALIGGALAFDRDDPRRRVDSKCILRYLN